MKKRLFSLVLALILSAGTAAAVSAAEAETVKQYSISEVGIKTDTLVNMYDGITRVWVNGKVGFIDENGNTVTAPKYDYATDMIDGVAVVGYALPETFTYTNQETGEEVVGKTYELYVVNKDGVETQLKFNEKQQYRIEGFGLEIDENGFAPVQRKSNSTYDITIANGVIQVESYLFYRYDGTPITVADIDAAEELFGTYSPMLTTSLDFDMMRDSYDGIIPMRASVSYLAIAPITFYMDFDGNITKVFKPFEDVAGGEEGIVIAYAPVDGYSVVYSTDYDSFWGVGDNGGYGVMNADGEYVIAPDYSGLWVNDDGSTFIDGNVLLVNKEGKRGIMNVSGEVVIPFDYDYLTPLVNGVAVARIGDEYTVIDAENNAIDIVDENGKVIDNITGISKIYDNGVFEVTTTETYVYTGGSVSPWASMHYSTNAPTTVTETKYYLVDTVLEDGVLTAIEGADDYCIIGTGDGEYWEYIDWTTGTLGYIKVNVEEVAAEAEEECNYPVTWSPLWRSVTGGSLIG